MCTPYLHNAFIHIQSLPILPKLHMPCFNNALAPLATHEPSATYCTEMKVAYQSWFFDIWSSEPACPPTLPKGALWSFVFPSAQKKHKEQIVETIHLADRAPAQTAAALLSHGLLQSFQWTWWGHQPFKGLSGFMTPMLMNMCMCMWMCMYMYMYMNMNMSMYMCTYIYVYMYMYTYMYMYMHIYKYIHMYMYMYMYMHMYMHLYMYMYMYVYMYMYIDICICIYISICVYIYIYIYLFICLCIFACVYVYIYIYIYVYGLVKEWVVGTRKLNPYHNLRHLWLTLFIEHVEHHVDDAPLWVFHLLIQDAAAFFKWEPGELLNVWLLYDSCVFHVRLVLLCG